MKSFLLVSTSLFLMIATVSGSAFASKLCGFISHEGNDPGTGTAIFSLTETNGTNWEVDPANNDAELSLLGLSQRMIHAHGVRVCVTGHVLMHDSDKGYVFSALSAEQDE